MSEIDKLHDDSRLRDVVEAMLRDVLPDETSDNEIADLVEAVMSNRLVRRHDGRCWKALTRGDASSIARVIGQVAADAILDDYSMPRLNGHGEAPKTLNS